MSVSKSKMKTTVSTSLRVVPRHAFASLQPSAQDGLSITVRCALIHASIGLAAEVENTSNLLPDDRTASIPYARFYPLESPEPQLYSLQDNDEEEDEFEDDDDEDYEDELDEDEGDLEDDDEELDDEDEYAEDDDDDDDDEEDEDDEDEDY